MRRCPPASSAGAIERRITVDAVEAVLGEDCAERSGDRNATLGVDLVGECRDKLVHLPLTRFEADGFDWMNKQRFGAGSRICEKWVEEAALDPPVASKEAAACFPHPTHRTGINGIAWDNMGVNGNCRVIAVIPVRKLGMRLRASHRLSRNAGPIAAPRRSTVQRRRVNAARLEFAQGGVALQFAYSGRSIGAETRQGTFAAMATRS